MEHETQPRRSIALTRDRAFDLANKHRLGDEPLAATVQRMLERYDALVSQQPAARPYAEPAQPAGQNLNTTA